MGFQEETCKLNKKKFQKLFCISLPVLSAAYSEGSGILQLEKRVTDYDVIKPS